MKRLVIFIILLICCSLSLRGQNEMKVKYFSVTYDDVFIHFEDSRSGEYIITDVGVSMDEGNTWYRLENLEGDYKKVLKPGKHTIIWHYRKGSPAGLYSNSLKFIFGIENATPSSGSSGSGSGQTIVDETVSGQQKNQE